MSVLIKGMEMPSNCCECAIRSYDANSQEEYCPITEIECLSIGRQDACPLTEVEDTKQTYSEFISRWKLAILASTLRK